MAIDRWRGNLSRGGTREPRSVERFMDDWAAPFFRNAGLPRLFGDAHAFGPQLDMVDEKDAVLLHMDLPGMQEQDIDIMVEQGMLTVRGERKSDQESKQDQYYCCERWSGSFERTITLPSGVDPDKIDASFTNGVLQIRIPKSEKALGRKIEIKKAA